MERKRKEMKGVWSTRLDIKSPAKDLFKYFIDIIADPYPKLTEEPPSHKTIDEKKTKVSFTMNNKMIVGRYSRVTATIVFIRAKKNGDGGKVGVTVIFEKITSGIEEPRDIIEALTDLLEKGDKNLHRFPRK